MSPTSGGADDIVVSKTYDQAITGSGGLWNLKSGDPNVAEINKNLEVTGSATFTDVLDLTGSPSAQLQLGAASLLLPNQITTPNTDCNGANAGMLRFNTIGGSVEVCDGTNFVNSGSYFNTNANGIDYGGGNVGIGVALPNDALDVAGSAQITGTTALDGAVTAGSTLGVTGATTLTGSLTANGTSAFNDSVVITSTVTDATPVLTINQSGPSEILRVQSDGNVGIGDNSPNDALDVSGAIDLTETLKIDGTNVVNNGSGTDTILIGQDAGANVTGDNNTILGAGAATTLTTGTGNIIIGQGADVTAATNNDILNVGNLLQGDLANNRLGIGFPTGTDISLFNDALEVNGNGDFSGALNVTGTSTFGDNMSITGDTSDGSTNPLSIEDSSASVVFTVDSNGRVDASDFFIDGTKDLDPGGTCGAGNFSRWDGNSWQCDADGTGGGDGVGADGLPDVLANDASANNIAITDVADPTNAQDAATKNYVDTQLGSLSSDRIEDNDGNTYVDVDTAGDGSANTTIFQNAGSESARFDASGNLGVGTNNPSHKITVLGGDVAIREDDDGNTAARLGAGLDIGWLQLSNAGTLNTYINSAVGAPSYFNAGPVVFGNSVNDASAKVQIDATNAGFLAPRMTASQRDAIATPATGLLIFATDAGDSGIFQFYDGAAWIDVGAGGATGAGLWVEDGTNNYIEYDDTLGGVRIGRVTGQPAPVTDWEIDTTNSVVYTTTNTLAIGSGTVSGTLQVDVTGDIGAAQYCDEDGNNCFTAATVAGGGGGLWTDDGTYISYDNAHILDTGAALDAALDDNGKRFFYYENKSVLRGGEIVGGNAAWLDANIGQNSVAWGLNPRAVGYASTAFGDVPQATGQRTVAMGYHPIASGDYSTAIGRDVTSSGYGSTALGFDARAGNGTGSDGSAPGTGLGDYSIVLGAGNSSGAIPQVTGDSSIGIFMGDQAGVDVSSSNLMAVLGGDLVVGAPQLDDETSGTYDNRMFFDVSKGAFRAGTVDATHWNDANVGDFSIAMGEDVIASGASSVAIGRSARALGGTSYAIGQETHTQGSRSITFGLGNASAGVEPVLQGDESFAVFMGAQDGVVLTQDQQMSILGGNILIDPAIPATQLTARTSLDVGAATDAFFMPSGTVAERPATPLDGMFRFNSENDAYEVYSVTASDWIEIVANGAIVGGVAGNDTEVQFNDAGAPGADPGLTYDQTTDTLSVASVINVGEKINIAGVAGAAPTFADLNDLDDVSVAGPTNGFLLSYDSSGGTWVAIDPASISAAISDRVQDTGDANTYIDVDTDNADGNNTISLVTAGSERMHITSAGDVGIGTATPSLSTADTVLTISNTNADSSAALEIQGLRSGSDGDIGGIGFYNDNTLLAGITARRINADNSGSMLFTTTNAGVENERMRITRSGNIGIGTNSPSHRLDILDTQATSVNTVITNASADAAASANLIAATDAGIVGIGTGSIAGGAISYLTSNTAGGLAINSEDAANSRIVLQTGVTATPRMYIDHAGLVGIGGAAPNTILDIGYAGGTGTTDPAILRLTNTTSQGSAKLQLMEENTIQGFEIENFSNAAGSVNHLAMRSFPNLATPIEFMRVDRADGHVKFVASPVSVGGPVSAVAQLQLIENIDAAGADGVQFEYDGVGNIFHIKSGFGGTYNERLTMERDSGNFGIGTTTPQTRFDINGTLKIADGSEACDANREGAIRYDGAGDVFYFCATAASGWEAISLGSGVTDLDGLSDAYHDTATDFDGDTLDNDDNIALGHTFTALDGTTPGARNTAIGATALDGVTTGDSNIAVGYDAGTATTTGNNNVLVGRASGAANTAGNNNVYIGDLAGTSNDSSANTVVGYQAGQNMTGGTNNTYFGYQAGVSNIDGDSNIMIGVGTNAPTANTNDWLNIGDAIEADMATREVFIDAPAAAPVDGDFNNGSWSLWLDEVNNEFELKGKKADGTVITQTVGATSGFTDRIQDTDNDTFIDVDTTDDDTIRISTLTKERLTMNNAGGLTYFGAQGDTAAINATDACAIAGAIHYKNDATSAYTLICNGANWIPLAEYNLGGKVLLGFNAADTSTGNNSITIGNGAANTDTIDNAIAIGNGAFNDGLFAAGGGANSSIAIGDGAGNSSANSIAIGNGAYTDSNNSIVIGEGAYTDATSLDATVIGRASGTGNNADESLSIGVDIYNDGYRSYVLGSNNNINDSASSYVYILGSNVTANPELDNSTIFNVNGAAITPTQSDTFLIMGADVGIGTLTPQSNMHLGAAQSQLRISSNSDNTAIIIDDMDTANRTSNIDFQTGAGGVRARISAHTGDSGTDNELVFSTSNTVARMMTMSSDNQDGTALGLDYTVDKGTGTGDDWGVLIRKTDTASPGVSRLIEGQTDTTPQFWVDDAGYGYFRGELGIGTTSPAGSLHVVGDNRDMYLDSINGTNASYGPDLQLRRSRAGAIVAEDDKLGGVRFFGHDGVDYRTAGTILVEVDGTPGSGDMPARMIFNVSQDGELVGDGTPEMVIKNTGLVGIGTETPSGILDVEGSSFFLPGDAAAPADTAFANSQWTLWLDEANNEFELKAKKADGTVITQTVGASAGAIAIDDLTDAEKDVVNNNLFMAEVYGSALTNNTQNTGVGIGALDALTNSAGAGEGDDNTAFGFNALTDLTTGSSNVAIGTAAGGDITSATDNTAIGVNAGRFLSLGSRNVAIGRAAGSFNETGNNNITIGVNAGQGTTGTSNIADNIIIGFSSAIGIQTGANLNTIMGHSAATALTDGTSNTLIGQNTGDTLTTGDFNIMIGAGADVSAATASNELNIGNLIYGNTSTGALLLGQPTFETFTNSAPLYQFYAESATADMVIGTANSDSATSKSDIELFRARGSRATPTIVQDGDYLGSLRFSGYDGTDFRTSAAIEGIVTSAPSGGTMPTSLIFRTGNTGTGTERMRISHGGNVGIGATNPDTLLHVYDAGNNPQIRLEGPGDSIGEIVFEENGQGDNFIISYSGVENVLQFTGSDGGLLMSLSRERASLSIGGTTDTLDANDANIPDGTITIEDGALCIDNGGTNCNDVSREAGSIYALGTGSVLMPAGTTAQRPTGIDGMIRFNNTTDSYEVYSTTAADWVAIVSAGVALGSNAAGTDTQVIYNDSGSLTGEAAFTYDQSNDTMTIASVSATDRLSLTPKTSVGTPNGLAINDLSDVNAGSATDGQVLTWVNANNRWEASNDNNGFWTSGSGDDIYYTGTTPKVGIGTTTPASDLHIYNAAADAVLAIEGDETANSAISLLTSGDAQSVADAETTHWNITARGDNNATSANERQDLIIEYWDGTSWSKHIGIEYDTGHLGIGTTEPTVELDVIGDIEYTGTITDVSDARLKESIEPLNKHGALLERIDRIETVSFVMKDDKDKRTEFGVIAQQLETVFPELVHTAKDEMGTKSVNYVGLIAPMIEATKELKDENAALKTELETIRSEREDVKNAVASLTRQVDLLNKAAGNNVEKASIIPLPQSWLLLLIGFLSGLCMVLVVSRKKHQVG